jgi:hypothetical protein
MQQRVPLQTIDSNSNSRTNAVASTTPISPFVVFDGSNSTSIKRSSHVNTYGSTNDAENVANSAVAGGLNITLTKGTPLSLSPTVSKPPIAINLLTNKRPPQPQQSPSLLQSQQPHQYLQQLPPAPSTVFALPTNNSTSTTIKRKPESVLRLFICLLRNTLHSPSIRKLQRQAAFYKWVVYSRNMAVRSARSSAHVAVPLGRTNSNNNTNNSSSDSQFNSPPRHNLHAQAPPTQGNNFHLPSKSPNIDAHKKLPLAGNPAAVVTPKKRRLFDGSDDDSGNVAEELLEPSTPTPRSATKSFVATTPLTNSRAANNSKLPTPAKQARTPTHSHAHTESQSSPPPPTRIPQQTRVRVNQSLFHDTNDNDISEPQQHKAAQDSRANNQPPQPERTRKHSSEHISYEHANIEVMALEARLKSLEESIRSLVLMPMPMPGMYTQVPPPAPEPVPTAAPQVLTKEVPPAPEAAEAYPEESKQQRDPAQSKPTDTAPPVQQQSEHTTDEASNDAQTETGNRWQPLGNEFSALHSAFAEATNVCRQTLMRENRQFYQQIDKQIQTNNKTKEKSKVKEQVQANLNIGGNVIYSESPEDLKFKLNNRIPLVPFNELSVFQDKLSMWKQSYASPTDDKSKK